MRPKRLCRREFLGITGLASAVVLLAACQQPAQPTEAPKPKAPEPAAPATKPATKEVPTAAPALAGKQRVKIEFLGQPGMEEKIPEEQGKFHGENAGVEWVMVRQAEAGSRLEQLMSLVAAGTPPDTARVESDVYRTFAHYGLLLSLSDYIKNDPELSKPDYWIQPQESDRCVYQGKWYGIGSCWVAPHLYYNRELLDELGAKPPSNDPAEAWTWDDFLKTSQQLTVDAGGKHPGESGFDVNKVQRWGVNWPTWWIPLHAAIQSNGASWVDKQTGKIALDKPEAMDALQRVSDLMHVHRVMPMADVMKALGMGGAQLLETKKVALAVDGSWSLATLHKIKGGLGTAVLPKITRPGTDMQAHLVTVVKNTKSPDDAWKLIRFFSSPWYQERYLRAGLWLPSQNALLTDDAISRWLAPPIHPKGYELIVKEYARKYGHYLTMPVGYRKAEDTALKPAFDKIWLGEGKVAELMPKAVAEANRIMEQEQSRPSPG